MRGSCPLRILIRVFERIYESLGKCMIFFKGIFKEFSEVARGISESIQGKCSQRAFKGNLLFLTVWFVFFFMISCAFFFQKFLSATPLAI